MKNILYIDTTDNSHISVSLEINEEKKHIKIKLDNHKSQILLPLIDKLLSENKIKPQDISEIKINTGPGSYTGIRVGLAVASTLSYTLKIPINSLPLGKLPEQIYS